MADGTQPLAQNGTGPPTTGPTAPEPTTMGSNDPMHNELEQNGSLQSRAHQDAAGFAGAASSADSAVFNGSPFCRTR